MAGADLTRLRERMVSRLIAGSQPPSAMVADALRAVPRHVFLPELEPEAAYRDEAIVTKRDADGQPTSSSSQPTIMAIMLDQLGLAPGHRVLEIGAGTGYNAALLSHIVGPEGTVVSIDLDEDVAEQARAHLAAAGCPEVTVVCGDGAAGYPARAPYDRVIATVGVSDLAPPWLSQLAPGGRIVVPLDLRGAQRSVAFERAGACWQSRSAVPCGFMRMRGSLAGPERTQVSGDARELTVTLPDGRDVDITAVARALSGPAAECVTGVVAGPAQLFDGLGLWLALNEPRWGVLTGTAGAATVAALARAPVRVQDRRATAGIFARESFAVLARPDDPGPGTGPGSGTAPGTASGLGPGRPMPARQARPPGFTLCVLGYGPAGAELAAELAGLVGAWDAAGRPGTDGLGITACPKPSRPAQPTGRGAVISRPHTTFTVSAGR